MIRSPFIDKLLLETKTMHGLTRCLIVVLVLASSHAFADQDLAAFEDAIRAKYDVKVRAFARNDADLLVDNFYSEDVLAVYPDGSAVVGRENLRPIYRDTVVKSTVSIESIKTHVDNDTGWDWTNFYVFPEDPKKDDFSFIVLFLWQKIDGEWFVVGDMFLRGKLESL